MYEDFIKGTKDNSENSTYTGRILIFQEYLSKALNILTGDADFEEDEHHATKRKEFYQVDKLVFLSFKNGPKGQKNRLQRAKTSMVFDGNELEGTPLFPPLLRKSPPNSI